MMHAKLHARCFALAALVCAAVYFLYFFGLTRVGMLLPDEPRYAAIGRAMADSGDWVTPRLWGLGWYEKPALIYWMTGLAVKAGLGPDLAPRLPIALLSVAFLALFFVVLRREFGALPAFFGTLVLGTSAGWLAYSHVAVPDLPLSATFAAAMLLLMGTRARVVWAGILLGLAVLAKGLLPLALFLPAVWWMWRRKRDLVILLATAFIVAAPWYILVIARNGSAFVNEFFWKHHFARLVSPSIMHVKPVWYYIPVLLAGLFPWTPLYLLPILRKRMFKDPRLVFLLAWFGWGFLCLSLTVNKLPGYLLPLLPPLAALVGVALSETARRTRVTALLLALSAALLALFPAVQNLLPQALLYGLSRAHVQYPLAWVIPVLLLTISCAALELLGRRELAVTLIAIGVTVGAVSLVWRTFPVLDETVSPRAFWRSHAGLVTCIPPGNRSWRYGLSYYAGRNLPDCP